MPNTTPITSAFADQRGFTLIEALTAIVVLVVGIISLYTMQTGAIQANTRADSISRLSNWATDRIERVLTAQNEYDELRKNDPSKADTAARGFGLNDPRMQADDSEPNYLQLGLNCAAYEGKPDIFEADYCQEAPDGRGLIFLNTAEDASAPGVKTIRAKVVTRDFGSQAVVTSTTYFISKRD